MTSIAVLGATGRTGRLVVEQALARGHRVTAIVRRAGSLPPTTGLTVIIADPAAPPADVLAGHDAVISALGATGRGPTDIYSTSTAAIIAALPTGGRLLVISSAGIAAPENAGWGTRLLAGLLHRVMRNVYSDMTRMERMLMDSDLRWTAMRPTRLIDTAETGTRRISLGAKERLGSRTSRADLAAYLLDAITDPATFGTTVAISS